jgi:Glycosyltransferase family 87
MSSVGARELDFDRYSETWSVTILGDAGGRGDGRAGHVAGAGPGHGGDVGGRRHLRGVRAGCLCGLLADLEAASNLLLAAALAVSVGVRRLQVWQLWSAGALLGVATATKIWGVVPLLIIVAFLWHRDGRAVGGNVASNSSPSDDDPGSPRCAATR